MVELVALDGLHIGQAALVDLSRLLRPAQGLEFLLLTQVDQLCALFEFVVIGLEMLLLFPWTVCLAAQQALIIGKRHAHMGAVLLDQMSISIDCLVALAGSAAIEPFRHPLAVMLGSIRPARLAAQEQGDSVRTGLAEGAATEFCDGDDIEYCNKISRARVYVEPPLERMDDGRIMAGKPPLLSSCLARSTKKVSMLLAVSASLIVSVSA